MALLFHHGPRLADLAEVVVTRLEALAETGVDPFEPVLIGVPTPGVREWLQRHLAQRLGIAAGLDIVYPAQFLRRCMGDVDTGDDAWAVERLTWAVWQEMLDSQVSVPGPSTLAAARHVADLFDQYATTRPGMLVDWADDIDAHGLADTLLPAGQRWQPSLWRAVRRRIASPSPAERRAGLLGEISAGRRQPAVPTVSVMFATNALTPAQWEVLRVAATVRDVVICAVHPSPAAWARSGVRLGGRLVPRSTLANAPRPSHPLLASWAGPSAELAALVSGSDVEITARPPAPTVPTSMLGVLQRQLFDDAPGSDRPPAADGSVQVHLCHGLVRQLEVMRDALCGLLAADHSLQPHDILIVSDCVAEAAPVAESVFARSTLPLPVRVTDRSLVMQADMVGAVAPAMRAALALLTGRCTVGEVLELCSMPAVARRLELTADDVARIQEWVIEMRVRWGLDGDHRAEWLEQPIDDGTWQRAVERLLVGVMMPAPVMREAVHGVVPFDTITSDGAQTAGRLAALVHVLRTARHHATAARPIADWCSMFTSLLNDLCAADPAAPWQIADAMRAITSVAEHAVVGGRPVTTPIERGEAVAVVSAALAEAGGRLSLRSGAITLTSMVPMRNVPFRVIGVLGVGDTRAGDGTSGDDVLAVMPCVGERDAAAEHRGLLLDTVLAARDALVITVDGFDVTTNRPLAVPVAVGELLDVIGTGVVTRHTRHVWNAANVDVHAPVTFDPSAVAAAEALRSPRPDQPPVRISPAVPVAVTLNELVDACTNPSRTYLRDGLDARLPADREQIDDQLSIDADPLERSALGRSLMDHHRRADDPETAVQQWQRAARMAGSLPPRQLALAVVESVGAEVREVIEAHPDVGPALANQTVVPLSVDVAVPPWAGAGAVTVHHEVARMSADSVVRVEFARPRPRHLVAASLELAMLGVVAPDTSWSTLLVTRPERVGKRPHVRRLALRSNPGAAQRLMEVAVDLRLRAAREPLPLFESLAQVIAQDGVVQDETVFEGAAFTRGDLGDPFVHFLWADARTDDVLALAYVDHVDAPIPPRPMRGFSGVSRAASYAHYLWSAIGDAVEIAALSDAGDDE